MQELSLVVETIECRVAIVDPSSKAVLALQMSDRTTLPHVQLSRRTRFAQQLTSAIYATWGLQVLILDSLKTGSSSTNCIVVALLIAGVPGPQFSILPAERLIGCALSNQEAGLLFEMLKGKRANPFSRLGWIDDAISWIVTATGQKLSSKRQIEQWNFGGEFALLRLRMDEGGCYWLKATGKPNKHEYDITVCLSELYSDFLPPLIATRKEWNAWLTKEFGEPFADLPPADAMTCAATNFATFQLETINGVEMLLSAGAFDQRLRTLREHIDPIFRFLADAMTRQRSTKVPPLGHERLQELAILVTDACDRMESLGIPDTLLHNDLNAGNILYDGRRCVFTDWSEAAVGNPFLACERLCRLNVNHGEVVHTAYRKLWIEQVGEAGIREAFTLAPLLDVFAYLYGRGYWIACENHPQYLESRARSLARHMDRIAHTFTLRDILCR